MSYKVHDFLEAVGDYLFWFAYMAAPHMKKVLKVVAILAIAALAIIALKYVIMGIICAGTWFVNNFRVIVLTICAIIMVISGIVFCLTKAKEKWFTIALIAYSVGYVVYRLIP